MSMFSSTFCPFVRKASERPQRWGGVNTEAGMIIYSISSPPECVFVANTASSSNFAFSAFD